MGIDERIVDALKLGFICGRDSVESNCSGTTPDIRSPVADVPAGTMSSPLAYLHAKLDTVRTTCGEISDLLSCELEQRDVDAADHIAVMANKLIGRLLDEERARAKRETNQKHSIG